MTKSFKLLYYLIIVFVVQIITNILNKTFPVEAHGTPLIWIVVSFEAAFIIMAGFSFYYYLFKRNENAIKIMFILIGLSFLLDLSTYFWTKEFSLMKILNFPIQNTLPFLAMGLLFFLPIMGCVFLYNKIMEIDAVKSINKSLHNMTKKNATKIKEILKYSILIILIIHAGGALLSLFITDSFLKQIIAGLLLLAYSISVFSVWYNNNIGRKFTICLLVVSLVISFFNMMIYQVFPNPTRMFAILSELIIIYLLTRENIIKDYP